MINFPFLTNGKLIILGVPILKHITVLLLKKCELLLQCKRCSHFFNKKFQCIAYKVVKHLTS